MESILRPVLCPNRARCYIRCAVKLIRTLVTLTILALLVYAATTVKLGERTFFGHVARIWSSDEAQELVDGVKETSGPVMEKVKRGVKAGLDEANRDDEAGASAGKDRSEPASPDRDRDR